MKTPIAADPNAYHAVVDESTDGLKAVPVELVTKSTDDSTFTQVNANNGLPVSLSGRKVIKTVSINAQAITDTNFRFVSLDVSDYSEVMIVIKHTLDQALKTKPGISTNTDTVTSTKPSLELTLTGSSTKETAITKDDWPGVLGGVLDMLRFAYYCSTAPTTGSVTITIYGRKN